MWGGLLLQTVFTCVLAALIVNIPRRRKKTTAQRPIPKERGQITSGVALQNPTHASSLPIDCCRWCC